MRAPASGIICINWLDTEHHNCQDKSPRLQECNANQEGSKVTEELVNTSEKRYNREALVRAGSLTSVFFLEFVGA